MEDFGKKFNDVVELINGMIDKLNGSQIWATIQSILGKIAAVLGWEGEDEAKAIIDIVGTGAAE